MSKSRLIDYDPVTKVRQMLHDGDGEDFHIEDVQNVGGRVDVNRELYKLPRSGWGDGQRVASIPLVVWQDLKRRGIADDPGRLKAWLNDPDNRAFRTRPGRV